MAEDDETTLSEITILPDGRIYVFGMSRQVLEILQPLVIDPRLDGLWQRTHDLEEQKPSSSMPGPTGDIPVREVK